MAPNITEYKAAQDAPANGTTLQDVKDDAVVERQIAQKKKGFFEFETDIIWPNVILITTIHIVAVYCALTFDYLQDWRTSFFMYWMYTWSGFGVTAGAHRYWTHKAYKVKLPLKIVLLACYASAGENKLYDWVRDHRVHHRYTDTPADPHNNKRGVFFSHVGWLMMRKNAEVIKKGREVDMTDISSDPMLVFFDKHFRFFKIMCAFVLPTLVPVLFWNETWSRAFISQAIIRYVFTLNCTWSVNSLAHTFGSKPFDKNIRPSDNAVVAFLAGGEGWHNYHHVFPWDYNTSEHGFLNMTKLLIDGFSLLGWAYECKTVPDRLVRAVKLKRGINSEDYHEEVPYDSLNEK